MGSAKINRSSGPSTAVMAAYSSSPAAASSSFYSSMLQSDGGGSLSLKSTTMTPHRHKVVMGSGPYQHSKSHSISGSREATPVRVVGSGTRRANSERFDRGKTASLPLPKRRQLSLSANYSGGGGDPAAEDDDEIVERGEHETVVVGTERRGRGNILSEDVYNLSNAGDNCSFVTITGNAFSNRRDSNCTLNSNSYKEQYILGSNYNNNINRHSQEHYDAMLLSSTVVRLKDRGGEGQEASGGLGGDQTVAPAKGKECEVSLEAKPHHYGTNSKSLEDIL